MQKIPILNRQHIFLEWHSVWFINVALIVLYVEHYVVLHSQSSPSLGSINRFLKLKNEHEHFFFNEINIRMEWVIGLICKEIVCLNAHYSEFQGLMD